MKALKIEVSSLTDTLWCAECKEDNSETYLYGFGETRHKALHDLLERLMKKD